MPRASNPMTRVQLSLLAPGRSCLVLQVSKSVTRRCSQDSKASACKADKRECNSRNRLQIVVKKFCAGVAQWEERGPRKSVIGVRIAAPAPQVCCCGRKYKGTCLVSGSMLVGIQPAAPNSMAGLAEWFRRWIVAPVTRVRFSHLAPTGRFV